jgi:dTDP-4-dehydrorhamnose 3,5-epimerase
MKFTKTRLSDAWLIALEPRADERGFFARTFCAEEFAAHGLATAFPQTNHSRNRRAGTLRGMHFQRAPHGEVKLVRVVRGAIHDVIVDLRPGSPSFGAWQGFDLTAENGLMLYVPKGFAHGFQTLEDDTDVTYQVSAPYAPGAEGGARWDDPALGIAWPRPVAAISEKDASWADVDLEAIAAGREGPEARVPLGAAG